jgi:hypothetical protein
VLIRVGVACRLPSNKSCCLKPCPWHCICELGQRHPGSKADGSGHGEGVERAIPGYDSILAIEDADALLDCLEGAFKRLGHRL